MTMAIYEFILIKGHITLIDSILYLSNGQNRQYLHTEQQGIKFCQYRDRGMVLCLNYCSSTSI